MTAMLDKAIKQSMKAKEKGTRFFFNKKLVYKKRELDW